ncbi:unnamed protein product [Larinioides sclopetarius]|uniref:Uncharacterized protein n=1 Tax=Larinioides sclopetarius TaxID=280406 RepID=A0AAV2AAB9_9ARAC
MYPLRIHRILLKVKLKTPKKDRFVLSTKKKLETDGFRKTGIAITIIMWLLILMFLGFELLQISKGYHWIPHSFLYFLITFVFWIALFKCGIAQCTCKNRSTRTQQDDVIGNFSGQQENV